jgi:hypothetical protein
MMKMITTMTVLMASTLVGVAEMKQGMQLVHEAVTQQQTEMRLIKQLTNEAYGMNVGSPANPADSTATDATPYTAPYTAQDTTAADNTAPDATAYTNPAEDKADSGTLQLAEQWARAQVLRQLSSGAADSNEQQQ